MSIIHQPSNDHFILAGSDTWVGLIDGSKIPDMASCYEAISGALRLPDYFGANLDALDEMLYDLDWLEHDFVLLIINNSSMLLSGELESKSGLLALFEEIDNPYLEIILL